MTACSLRARRNLESQGFPPLDDEAEAALARAARFQPRATLALLAVGVAVAGAGAIGMATAALWFAVLAALGWLAVVAPAANVFDRFWDLVVGRVTGWPGVGAPPAPRRFSQALAAGFLTTIAVLFALELSTAALIVSGVMAVAASLAGFGDLCIGSELHGLLAGRGR